MKKIILFLSLCLCLQATGFAQNNVQLNIHHKLGANDFALNMAAKNNIEHDFNISRLQYYISEIALVHDGGQVTPIEDYWILTRGATPVEENLGDYNINEIESISFHVGVDPDHNHLDPASWPNGHPLAPVFPSMHWGWAAGYRFVAIEGKGGSNLNQVYELHGLGDSNYFQLRIPVSVTAVDNAIVINLEADYTRILENITVANGTIVHGENGDAKTALQNFRDYVFSNPELINSVADFEEINKVDLYPNPTNRTSELFIDATEDALYQVQIRNVLGQTIQSKTARSNTNTAITIEKAGVYFIQILKGGQLISTKKLIVQ